MYEITEGEFLGHKFEKIYHFGKGNGTNLAPEHAHENP